MASHLFFIYISIASWVLICTDALQYYVSTTGSDVTGDGTQSNPWATIQNSQKNVQYFITTLNKHSYSGNITINIDSGIYQGPLLFGVEDSMTGFQNNNYVIYQALTPSKHVYIYGAERIATPWTKSTRNGLYLYQTNLTSQSNAYGLPLYELFIDHASQQTADRISMSKSKLLTYEYVNVSAKQMITNHNTIPNIQAIMSTDYSMHLMVLIYEHWTSSYHYVQKIDYVSGTGVITLTLDTCPGMVNDASSGYRFYLLNNEELLSMNDQFYYNQSNMNLHLLTNKTLTTDTSVLFAKDIEIVSIKGTSPIAKVERLLLRGLRLKYSAIDFSSCFSGTCQTQSVAFLNTATLHTMNADHIILDGVHVKYSGGYGVWLDEGTTNTQFVNGLVQHLGGGGIRIGVNTGGVVSDSQLVKHVLVSNNYIMDGGYVFEAGCGVLAQTFAYTNITNNEIKSFKYTGISTGWTWHYQATSVSNNIVARNRISDIGQWTLSDLGCIYTLGAQPNCVYDNNICHDVWTYDSRGGHGTYNDQASRYVVWRNNIIYRTRSTGHNSHYGLDNILVNNIYAFTMLDPMAVKEFNQYGAVVSQQRATECNYTSNEGACSSFAFITNIVYVNDTWGVDILGDPYKTYWKNMTLDGNTYWSVAQGANVTFPYQYSIDEWTKEGKDVQNALADPMFVDADNYDFGLRLGSPAIALGFHPIDTQNVGPKWTL
eukprot:175316_1